MIRNFSKLPLAAFLCLLGLISVQFATSGQADSIVRLQQSTPGVRQIGNANISGRLLVGSVGNLGGGIEATCASPTTTSGGAAVAGSDFYSGSQGELGKGSYGVIGSGRPNGSSDTAYGVYGDNGNAPHGSGVYGRTGGPSGSVDVYKVGVWGDTNSGDGVFGSTSFVDGYGVLGVATGSSGRGVVGSADGVTGHNVGVSGVSSSIEGSGIEGFAFASSGETYGVIGTTLSPSGYGVFSNGNFGASGTKSFRIDHPRDPQNKYLNHYCSEGPEPLNIYSGTIMTDANGEAWVQLPDYYDEINKDPRYQLTVIDDSAGPGFVQVKVAKKIRDNRFMIMTSAPNVEVSWEVKAVRNDLWVRKYGAPVETEKSEYEKGKYQRPELYGAPEEMGTDYRADRHRVVKPIQRPKLPQLVRP